MNIKFRLSILILVLSLVITTAHAQELDKNYDFGGNDSGLDITLLPDGYLLSGSGSGIKQMYRFVKVDTAGNVIWNKWLGNSKEGFNPVYVNPVEVDQFGNIYAIGTYYDSSYNNNLLVAKLSSEGDSIWAKHIDTIGTGFLYDVFYDTLKHKVYCTGAFFDLPMDSALNVLWVLDTSGNTLLLKYFSISKREGANSITVIDDTIFIGSITYDSIKHSEPVIYKLDTLGNVLSYKTYGTNLDDGGAVFSYSRNKLLMNATIDTLGNDYTQSLWLLDVHGDIIWKKIFTDNFLIYRATSQPNGDIIVVGITSDGYNSTGRIVKLDSTGAVIWERDYVHNDSIQIDKNDRFYDFDVDTLTGNIVIVGETAIKYGPNQIGYDIWLLRVDSLGCLIPGCDTITPISDISTIASNLDYNFMVYPNPANDKIMVIINQALPNALLEFTLYDLAGKRVYASTISTNSYGFGEWQLSLGILPPSLYLYHITDPSGNLQAGKLMIE